MRILKPAFQSLLSLCVVASAQAPGRVTDNLSARAPSGLQLRVVRNQAAPVLSITLPGQDTLEPEIRVFVPEHVTAVAVGDSVATHLYLSSQAARESPVRWRAVSNGLEYEREISAGVHFLARATVENDGVRFHYEFVNNSRTPFASIYAVTDPRLTGRFHDERLQRTYVHHASGFDLLAAETPARLTMPLSDWLPARYLASYTWPVPERLIERRADGVTYYTKSRRVDAPFIATVATTGDWVVASFTAQTGNVWSNPELTCQHVDPQVSLPAHSRAVTEVKVLVINGSLDDAFRRSQEQRSSLQ